MKLSAVKKIVPAVVILFLAFVYFHEPCTWGSSNDAEDYYTAALKEYRDGLYQEAAAKLESLLEIVQEERPEIRAKACLLLGACYEKLNKRNQAGLYFLELRTMLDKKLVDQVPVIEGIAPESFLEYREVFKESPFFAFKEPVPVSEMIKKNVVHAPRKSIEEKEKEKKKKKFPWLIVIGAVVVIGTAAVLLLTQKKGDKQEFKEVEWLHIPAGEFRMGDNFNEGQADELPVHTVYLDEYYISKYEITYEQYNYFCREAGGNEKQLLTPRWSHYSGGYPVTSVSYYEAKVFCDWLSKRIGKNVYLPTEAQWEKAARGNRQTRYPWGNDPPNCNRANYSGCADPDISVSGLMPVEMFAVGKSTYGVYNMAGNVWEWCRDWYDSAYYFTSPGKNPRGPANGTYCVIRGGSHLDVPSEIRSANRYYHNPSRATDTLGFRVVMEPGSNRNH